MIYSITCSPVLARNMNSQRTEYRHVLRTQLIFKFWDCFSSYRRIHFHSVKSSAASLQALNVKPKKCFFLWPSNLIKHMLTDRTANKKHNWLLRLSNAGLVINAKGGKTVLIHFYIYLCKCALVKISIMIFRKYEQQMYFWGNHFYYSLTHS